MWIAAIRLALERSKSSLIARWPFRILLEATGIEPPSLWAPELNMASVAKYIGAIGELLERGLLREARSIDPERYRSLMFHTG